MKKSLAFLLLLALVTLFTACAAESTPAQTEQSTPSPSPSPTTVEVEPSKEPEQESIKRRSDKEEFFDVVDEEPFFLYGENGQHYGYTMDFWAQFGCSVWCAVEDYRASASMWRSPSPTWSATRATAWISAISAW